MIIDVKVRYKKWINKNIDKKVFVGKNIFITGGNSGIGFELAKQCAYLKANVFLLCRNLQKAEIAKNEIISEYPGTKVTIIQLDLASFKSIENASNEIKKYDVDMFANNAGVYRLPKSKTSDGLDITIGTNFIGTYYLNELLNLYFNSLKHKVKILFQSSLTYRLSKLDLCDFCMEKRHYSPFKIYARSKAAINCLYDYKVQNNTNKNISFYLTHPGATYSPLIIKGYKNKVIRFLGKIFMKIFFHSPDKASLSMLKALESDCSIKMGPRGLLGLSGYPHKWRIKKNKKYIECITYANNVLKERLPY